MSVALEPTTEVPLQVLEHVSWETYESLLRDMQEQHVYARITYDQGKMTVMSPMLPKHERLKKLLARMVEILSFEFNIPICGLGQTTWKRKDLLKGLEPDECYYIQHEAQMRGRDEVDLKNDPPPDLVIEVDITHHPIDRMQIYAALGVPEVWEFHRDHLQAFKLENGKYVPIESSIAFPFLRVRELERFLDMRWSTDETSAMHAFRDSVVKLPR
jgi:Uma2 family endonuclease